MGTPVSVTLTSTGTAAAFVALDYLGAKYTSVSLQVSSLSSGLWGLYTTLDDITQTASASVQWVGLSTGVIITSTAQTVTNYSSLVVGPVCFLIQQPVAALRLMSTVASGPAPGATMKVLQGRGW